MPIRLCLVALNALPVISPHIPGPIGGMETRAWSLARGLARQPDVSVSFVVRDSRPRIPHQVDGVTLHLLHDRFYLSRESLMLRLQASSRFPWIWLRRPRWSDLFVLPAVILSRLWAGKTDPLSPLPICKRLPADVFVTFGVQQTSARVIAAARAEGRRSALFLASDVDLDERILTDPHFISSSGDPGAVCRWMLTHADLILCQTPTQQQNIQKFGREAILLRNPIDLKEWSPGSVSSTSEMHPSRTAGLSRYALWVGRADRQLKQPLLLVELAKQCPKIDFLMVMNRRDEVVEQEVRGTAPPNLKIVEQVPFSEMPAVMQRAAVLINTSPREGFPNTFLQAAACGVPVASLCVEEEFLRESRAGWCAGGDLPALANFLRDCWEGCAQDFDPVTARDFLFTHHSLERQSAQLATYLKQLAEQPPRSTPFV